MKLDLISSLFHNWFTSLVIVIGYMRYYEKLRASLESCDLKISKARKISFSGFNFQLRNDVGGQLFISFIQGDHTLSRKKLSRNHHIVELDA